MAGGPAPGVSAARRLAERTAAVAADTVPRVPPDTGQQRCRTGLWHFAAEQYGSTGGSMRPRLPDQWYGPCPLVPTRVMPAVRCRASTFGLEVNSLLHRLRIGDRRPRHIPEPVCRQEPHLEHRGGELCRGDKYRPTSGTKELKKMAPATLPSAGRHQMPPRSRPLVPSAFPGSRMSRTQAPRLPTRCWLAALILDHLSVSGRTRMKECSKHASLLWLSDGEGVGPAPMTQLLGHDCRWCWPSGGKYPPTAERWGSGAVWPHLRFDP